MRDPGNQAHIQHGVRDGLIPGRDRDTNVDLLRVTVFLDHQRARCRHESDNTISRTVAHATG
jgi:hypothetical protein